MNIYSLSNIATNLNYVQFQTYRCNYQAMLLYNNSNTNHASEMVHKQTIQAILSLIILDSDTHNYETTFCLIAYYV